MVTHRQEHTGDPLLDRIQANVLRVVQTVQQLLATVEARRVVSLMLEASFTTTAATAQSTKLTFAVKKGECWDVEFWGDASCSSVNGMCYAIGAPAGSTAAGWIDSSSTNTAVANWLTDQVTAPNTLSSACHAGASNVGRPDRINVRVKAGADGFVTLQVASVTAATTTTIAAKSHLRASKVVEA